jgi:ABC-type uncharacterized transport system substrate-binding protein
MPFQDSRGLVLLLSRPLIFAFGLLWPISALAHPHVWVAMHTDVVVGKDGRIDGVDVAWSFDDAYAAEALNGMDANGDGKYSPEELAPLTAENINSLKDYNYFTVMHGGENKLEALPPTFAGQSYNDNILQLHFRVPLKTPYDPHQGEFKVKVYDPEFFIAFDYVRDKPVRSNGNVPEGCKMILEPVPTDAETNKTLAMLSTKGRDWKPENSEDFGSMFAQALVVTCAS